MFNERKAKVMGTLQSKLFKKSIRAEQIDYKNIGAASNILEMNAWFAAKHQKSITFDELPKY